MLPLRVGFVLANNFTLTALATFVDVLRLAADEGDLSRPIGCRWSYMSSTGETIYSSSGLGVTPTSALIDPSQLDYVVVVGGLLHKGSQLNERTQAYLREVGKTGTPIIGLCTGSFIMCRLGLLDGRKCCISWYHFSDFLEEFGEMLPVADQLFVVDGKRITCSGGAGVAFLAAEIVDRHLGGSRAQKALHILQIDRMRPGSTSQPAPYSENPVSDDRVSRALLTMEQNIAQPLRIEKIAAKAGMSNRQLERLFKEKVGASPHAAYVQLRLRHARWMLKTDCTLASIAEETGFADASHLSKTFKAAFGMSPSEARIALAGEGAGSGDRRIYRTAAEARPATAV